MRMKPTLVISLSSAFVVAVIAVTMATGLWQTTSNGVPRKLQNGGGSESFSTTVQSGSDQPVTTYDPADIRGSFTFGDIAQWYQIPIDQLALAFQLTEAEAATVQVKTLEQRFTDPSREVGTASVRLFAAGYLGIADMPEEEVWLPQSAVEVLLAHGALSQAQETYLAAHSLP